MTISIAGNPLNANLGYLDIMKKVRDLIIANYTETQPPLSDVRFNFDWWENYGEFLCCIRNVTTFSDPENIGWTFMRNEMVLDVHLWVKQLTEIHPQLANNFQKEIQRILDDNKTALTGGISYMVCGGFQEIPEEDATSTLWHSVAPVSIVFRRVET